MQQHRPKRDSSIRRFPDLNSEIESESSHKIFKLFWKPGLSDHFEPNIKIGNLLRPPQKGFEVRSHVIFSQSGDDFPIIGCPLILLPHCILLYHHFWAAFYPSYKRLIFCWFITLSVLFLSSIKLGFQILFVRESPSKSFRKQQVLSMTLMPLGSNKR